MNSTRSTSPALGYLALFSFLFSLYLLTNAGRFHIIDEVSLFAVTESLVLHGEVNTNAIAWTQWVNSPGEVLGAFGDDGTVYSKKGPAPAFLAALWYLLLRGVALLNIDVGLLQATLLWNGLITGATALLLWNTATRLGYAQWVGAGLGLLFGVGTIAWPYATMFFGEPLSALALLLCFWGLVAWRNTGRNRYALAGGAGAAVAIATVTAHAPVVAAFALLALASMVRHGVPTPDYARKPRRDDPGITDPDSGADTDVASADVREPDGTASGSHEDEGEEEDAGLATLRFGIQAGLFLGPIMLAVLFIFIYNAVRFGSVFDTGYHFDSGEGFTTPILEGFWGLIGSPYRGLFWHTPLYLLSLLSLPSFFRRHRLEATSILVGSALLIGLYSMWWMWWGGFAWGPRFLVPMGPFWVLLLAPLLAAGFARAAAPVNRKRHRWRMQLLPVAIRPAGWLLMGVAALSIVVQIGAVSANFVNYEIELRARYPTDWVDPLAYGPPATALSDFADSPVIGQFRMLAGGNVTNLDFAWVWPNGGVRWLVVLIGLAVLLTTALIFGLWLQRATQSGAWTPSGPVIWLLPVLPLLLVAVWSGEVGRDPHYGVANEGYRAIVAEICSNSVPGDMAITVAPFAYQVPMNWLGAECRRAPSVYGYAAASMEHAEAQAALDRALGRHGHVWFITGGLAPNDPENSLEQWLAERAYKANDTWYGDYRLLVYGTDATLTEAPWRPVVIPLVGRGTSQITVLAARAPERVAAGEVLSVEIYFQLEAPSPNNLRWFVQLLSPEGVPVALLDTAPNDGYASFVDLPPEVELVERAGLWIAPETPPGEYSLIAGLYNPEDPEAARLHAPDGNDHVSLGMISVR